jgi:DUF917 family protein
MRKVTDITSSFLKNYSQKDLLNYIEGATLLASGGGGAKQIAKNLLDMSGVETVNAITSAQLTDVVHTGMVAQVFAPSAIWANQDFRSALNSFTACVGQGGVIMPVEVGAVNGIVPAIVASITNSVLLKDSTSDRSVPEMDMTLFQNSVPLCKVCMVPTSGTPIYQQDFGENTKALDAENYILDVMDDHVDAFQGVGGFVAYPMSGLDLKQYAKQGYLFENTFDYAIALGQAMKTVGSLDSVMAVIDDYLGQQYSPYNLFTGYLVASVQHPHAQDYGYADFKSADPKSILGVRIYYSNENMIAYATMWVLVQGMPTAVELFPIAMGPDAIGYLLLEGESPKGYQAGFSFSNEAFDPSTGDPQFFQTNKVALIGIPEPRLRRNDIINSFSREIARTRKSFGLTYDGKYVPVEDLPKLQSMLDVKASGRREIDDVLICFRKPSHTMEGWIDRNGPESSALSDEPFCVPFPRLQGRRVTMEFTSPDGQAKTIAMNFSQNQESC